MIRNRQRLRAGIGLLALGAALTLPSSALAAGERRLPSGPPTTPSDVGTLDRIIVEWEPGTTSAKRLDAREDADASFVRTLGRPSFQLVRPQAGQSVSDALASLRDDPNVRVAERDSFSVLHATPNDAFFGQLWGLENLGLGIDGFTGAVADADVDATTAWNRAIGLPSTVVADLDSGYRFDHPDLAGVAWTNPLDPVNGADDDGNGIVDDAHGADFVGDEADFDTIDGDPTDDNLIDGGHGVHTAGTIGAAGNNGLGITGVARNVRIMPLRVCAFSTSQGATRCPTTSQIAAINYAGAHGVRVANMSLGGTFFSAATRDAFAANPRTLYVISAGNDSQDNDPGGRPHYPCAYDPSTSGISGAIDNIVCVAATDQADALASFSGYGATTVDLGAPGTEVLSTYPWATHVEDTFTVNDFASKWSATGANGGFARTNESPLRSFGMSDSPGATPVANSVHESTSAAVTIPAGYTRCTISQSREVTLDSGGNFTYSVLLNGTTVISLSPSSSGNFFLDVTSGLSGGGSLQLRFRYTAGPAPRSGDGVWLDNIDFTCAQPVGQSTGYGFLDGTSMAAPHVTGAAGLLFSLKPTATVAEVKSVLLSSGDAAPALSGRTVTGKRLNVARALDALVAPGSETVAPDTALTSAPAGSTTGTAAAFAFRRTDADAGSFECRLDGATFAACTSPQSATVGLGAHTFEVRALDPFGHVDPTPASATWTVAASSSGGGTTLLPPPPLRCVVPSLKGLTLTRAKAKLRAAHCALGRVTKPRARRGRRLPPLVVKSSRPGARAVRASGTRIALTLAPKPRPRRHRRRRR